MAFDPITAALDLGGKLLDKILPDPVQRAQAQLQLEQLRQSGELAQIAVNQQEAASQNLWVAGWRPGVGWCCAAAFAYHELLEPLLTYIMAACGHVFALPQFNDSVLTMTLMGMLGLRGFEKMGDKGHLPWQQ